MLLHLSVETEKLPFNSPLNVFGVFFVIGSKFALPLNFDTFIKVKLPNFSAAFQI